MCVVCGDGGITNTIKRKHEMGGGGGGGGGNTCDITTLLLNPANQ